MKEKEIQVPIRNRDVLLEAFIKFFRENKDKCSGQPEFVSYLRTLSDQEFSELAYCIGSSHELICNMNQECIHEQVTRRIQFVDNTRVNKGILEDSPPPPIKSNISNN
jgi:hypothetical protein